MKSRLFLQENEDKKMVKILFVCHDADTSVSLPPVRGGVLDAPRSRDRRAALDASVRHDRF